MAIRDVKEYYYNLLNQYLQSKNDITDFEVALADGHITEDRLEEVKNELALIKSNLDRVQYIMYLFELPNRRSKQDRYIKINQDLKNYFKEIGASAEEVYNENKNALDSLRIELQKLKDENN